MVYIQTESLSGSAIRPHNWTREMPNDSRYGTDKPSSHDITNYAQIRVHHTDTGAPYCSLYVMQEGPYIDRQLN